MKISPYVWVPIVVATATWGAWSGAKWLWNHSGESGRDERAALRIEAALKAVSQKYGQPDNWVVKRHDALSEDRPVGYPASEVSADAPYKQEVVDFGDTGMALILTSGNSQHRSSGSFLGSLPLTPGDHATFNLIEWIVRKETASYVSMPDTRGSDEISAIAASVLADLKQLDPRYVWYDFKIHPTSGEANVCYWAMHKTWQEGVEEFCLGSPRTVAHMAGTIVIFSDGKPISYPDTISIALPPPPSTADNFNTLEQEALAPYARDLEREGRRARRGNGTSDLTQP